MQTHFGAFCLSYVHLHCGTRQGVSISRREKRSPSSDQVALRVWLPFTRQPRCPSSSNTLKSHRFLNVILNSFKKTPWMCLDFAECNNKREFPSCDFIYLEIEHLGIRLVPSNTFLFQRLTNIQILNGVVYGFRRSLQNPVRVLHSPNVSLWTGCGP